MRESVFVLPVGALGAALDPSQRLSSTFNLFQLVEQSGHYAFPAAPRQVSPQKAKHQPRLHYRLPLGLGPSKTSTDQEQAVENGIPLPAP